MKVTILRNPGESWNCELTEGQTGTVDDPLGKQLVAAGIAIEIVEPKPKAEAIKAVPSASAIAEEKPPAIQADKTEIPEEEPPHAKAERDLSAYVARQKRKPKTDKEFKS